MNTLSREVTGSFFTNRADAIEGYNALQKHWSSLVNSDVAPQLGPEHHLLYLALMGKDWRKAFTPITNPRKLDNGAFYDWGLQHALRRIHSNWAQEKLLAPFGDLVDTETLSRVRAVLPRGVASFDVPQAYEVPSNA